jgi:hypothetical protein
LRRNCLLKDIAEGKIEKCIEVMGKQGRRRKQLLDDLKETRTLKIERGSSGFQSVENSVEKAMYQS